MSENPNCNDIQTEHGCKICGFMDPDFMDTDDLYSRYCPRKFGCIAERGFWSYIHKVYPIFGRDVPGRYLNHDSFSWYQAVGPPWLQKELKRLFPEDTDPFLPFAFSDLASVSGSSSDSPILLYQPNQCHKKSNFNSQQDPISQRQPHVFTSLKSTFVQPYTNTHLPEALYSNMENSSNNGTTPTVSSSERISYEKFSTKERCMTSEMTHGDISSASNASNTNKWNEWTQTEYFWNRRQEEKQSFPDSYASVVSSSNGNGRGARPKIRDKVTVPAAGTSVSEDMTNWALASEGSEGFQWCSFCAKNGETKAMVMSHKLYSETNVLSCPILRAHRCEVCKATGDFAHTRSYCPRVRMLQGDVQSTITALKSTQRKASGKKRKAKAIMKSPN